MSDEEEVVVPEVLLAVPPAAAAVAVMRHADEMVGSFEVSVDQLVQADVDMVNDFSQALIDETHRLGCAVEWSFDVPRQVYMFRWTRR